MALAEGGEGDSRDAAARGCRRVPLRRVLSNRITLQPHDKTRHHQDVLVNIQRQFVKVVVDINCDKMI